MRVATGSYVGDGASSRSFSGLGFTPVAIFQRGETDVEGQEFYWKSAMFGADVLRPGFSPLWPDRIVSLDADGFTVGISGNETGRSYYWTALGADSTVFYESSYVGNQTPRSITGIGFQPDVVVSQGIIDPTDFNNPAVCKMTSMSGTNSRFLNSSAQKTDALISLDADGFSIGADAGLTVNKTGKTYYVFAFKASTGNVFQSSYVGNGVDNTDIVQGDPFAPKMVWVVGPVATAFPCLRMDVAAVNQAWNFGGSSLTNNIQDFNADGFEVGTNSSVNTNLAVYHYLSLVDFVPPPPPSFDPLTVEYFVEVVPPTGSYVDEALFVDFLVAEVILDRLLIDFSVRGNDLGELLPLLVEFTVTGALPGLIVVFDVVPEGLQEAYDSDIQQPVSKVT